MSPALPCRTGSFPSSLSSWRRPPASRPRFARREQGEGYIAVHVVPDQLMVFGGSSEPCALCSLHSIGKIGGAQNRSYSKLLCGLLAERLRVSPDRIYINYYDMNAANVGWNNSTFA
ncbi:macrophage migration inhibitory factor isoform X1 [Prionailurus viverrinus]|uniref:Macrophage migration inhibitory factor n=1 Tax=Acinonyx jubatus TaxID=32536 RepID=A0ABM3NQX7_ACIJB|nr:macrophage migration inhibitory factor isoform X1 [Prionailurus bengalensis]XP_044897600.1 macrophage migration inhibitory factor isoform X1 [Felis catus]XP_045313483.1 macrophage migration inhibitory factor isoform X1 [Leopardus geoffroyi]XP_047684417.1 macrophage migration inhibitory factor isoform X1 [Prionailurus viverrinus]XP_053061826.1 macrophage migration inhibitory factor isoform X1 [Acinonyx jubatus]